MSRELAKRIAIPAGALLCLALALVFARDQLSNE